MELAIASNERFALDTLELDRQGPSYSVDTLRVFGERLAPERPVFVIGEEAFAELGTWRDPEALLALAHFAVVSRPGPHGEKALADRMPPELAREVEFERDGRSARHRSAGTWVRLLAVTALDVSSTDIRRRLREGRSIRYLLPEQTRIAVVESGVYAAKEADA